MVRLEIFTLGGLHFRLDGKRVMKLGTRKVAALALYLAADRRVQQREFLAELLWPDRAQAQALANLRAALTNLRKHFGDYYSISRDSVSLTPDANTWLDAAELEARLSDAGQLAADSDERSRARVQQIEVALALYKGEFLQGFSVRGTRQFETWVTLERERLHQLVLSGFSQVVKWHLAQGSYAAGAAQAAHWLRLDPLNQAAHCDAMRLLAYNGQPGLALRQYRQCVRSLSEELGLAPNQETIDLYDAIQANTLQPPAGKRAPRAETVAPEAAQPPAPGKPPFKGLACYQAEDARLFFGREELTAELTGRLKRGRFLAVVGASGSGKSSLVRAGLLPALQNGRDTAAPAGAWCTYLLTPTAAPLKALAVSLTRTATSTQATTDLMDDLARDPRSLDIYLTRRLNRTPGQKLLLVVDQFEELFTQCRDDAARQAFIENIMTAVTGAANEGVRVVVTLRADFYSHCAHYDQLRQMLERKQIFIGQMTTAELRQAIEGPAAATGWSFESGLVDLLLHDVGADRDRKPEPGALPLLSHALLETWRHRQGREMTFASYAQTGGVRRAIARTAEAVYKESLTAAERPIARALFLRLTELGEGTQYTRRRATLAELIPRQENTATVTAVLDKLAAARLVTVASDGIEVAHEALIREWPRLAEWLAEDQVGLRLQRQLTESAQGWQTLERDEGALYRGARLAQASEWAEDHAAALNALEYAFLEASQKLARKEEEERRAQQERELAAARRLAAVEIRRAQEQAAAIAQLRRRRRGLIGALITASILAVVAIFFALRLRQSLLAVEEQNRIALARELAAAARANLESEPDLALLLAIEAVNATLQPDGFAVYEADAALRSVLTFPAQAVLRGHTDVVHHARFSPDGTLIVTASLDGTARLWDAAGRPLVPLTVYSDGVLDADFSPDGRQLVTTYVEGVARLWSNRGELLATLSGHTGSIKEAVFSRDGRHLLTIGGDGTARVWDENGQFLTTLRGYFSGGCFSPNGQRILTADRVGVARLWDLDGNLLTTFEGHTRRLNAAVFSPDGTRIVTASGDGTARLWEVDGRLVSVLTRHTDWVASAEFSPDGHYILTASADGTARLWDEDGTALVTLSGHTDDVILARYSPDGDRIVTASKDGTVRLWTGDGRLLSILALHAGAIMDASFSPDGSRILTAGEDGLAVLWLAAGPGFTPIGNQASATNFVAFRPDGAAIVTTGADNTAQLWATEGQLLTSPEGHEREVTWASFSPDGSLMVTASNDGTARIWSADGQLVAVLDGHEGSVLWAGFHPSGKLILTTGDDGLARFWRLDGTLVTTLKGHLGPVTQADFNREGTRLVTAGFDGNPRLWDISALARSPGAQIDEAGALITILAGHIDRIESVAFSPDGRYIATASRDRKAIIWDASGRYLAALEGHTNWVRAAIFSPSGMFVLTASKDHSAILWDISNIASGGPVNAVNVLAEHEDAVVWAGFTPEGQYIFTASHDGQLRMWDKEGRFLVALENHQGPIIAADLSPDGTKVATVFEDGQVLVWATWNDIEVALATAEARVGRQLSDGECQLYLHRKQCLTAAAAVPGDE